MTRVIVLFIMITSFVFSGCSSNQQAPPSTISDIVVSTTYDPQAKFPNTATYAFLRMNPEQEGLTPEAVSIMKRLRKAIQGELNKRKYKISKGGEIDYLIDYHIVATHTVEILAQRTQLSGREWLSVVGIPDDFIKGSLVIDAIDVKSLKPVWRGVCKANIALASISEEEKQKRAKYAVKQLLKTFPPN